jgi:hypothetical protein
MPAATKPLEIVKLIKMQVVEQQGKSDPKRKSAKTHLAKTK